MVTRLPCSAAGVAMHEVTRILSDVDRGDGRAAEQLLPAVYDELRRLATRKLAREKRGQTLAATALVHEAYLRLVGSGLERRWESRRHFFAAAAVAMRRILIENARRKRSLKRGGEFVRAGLAEDEIVAPEQDGELLALDEALTKLAGADRDAARLVELRYFSGLTIPQAAEVIGVSPRTADRLWAYARAWLLRELRGDEPPNREGENKTR